MYKQPRESFEARIYTPDYRIYGNIHLLLSTGTADLLNSDNRTHLPVTGAMIYTLGYEHPPKPDELKADAKFTAVHKSDVCWLVGGRASLPKGNMAQFVRKRLALFFGSYVLVGEIDIHKDSRLSDHLTAAKLFQTLHGAALYPLPANQPIAGVLPSEQFEFVTVNLSKIENIVEAPPASADMRLSLVEKPSPGE